MKTFSLGGRQNPLCTLTSFFDVFENFSDRIRIER